MDLLKLLQSLEVLLYELTLWLILLPKTFFKILIQPRWAYEYLISEWEKEPTDRFDQYMSPLFFWIIVAAFPYLLLFNSVNLQNRYDGQPKLFLVIALTFLGGPLGFARMIQRTRRTAIGRKSFKRVFYTQCFCFGPPTLLFLPYFWWLLHVTRQMDLNAEVTHRQATEGVLMFLLAVAAVIWLLIAETTILRRELPDITGFRARVLLLWGFVSAYALIFLLAFATAYLASALR
jgi:hypothetical protein